MASIEKYTSNEWQRIGLGPRGPRGLSSSLVAPSYIEDNLQEWWIYPVATYVEAEQRTVFGGYSTFGQILVNEVNHKTGEVKRVEIADSYKIDDHNNPAVYAEAGRRILVAWANHGYDDILRFKVSDSTGNIDSLVSAPEQNYTLGSGGTTYAQIHKIDHLSTSTDDVFRVFFRGSNPRWFTIQITVNQTTGSITFGSAVQLIQSPAQAYISTAPSYKGDGRIRLSWYHNPASEYSSIRYLEIDTVTGSIYSPLDGTSPIANISGTNLPLEIGDVTPLIPEPAAGMSRRMFYVRSGPMPPAVAYAEWDIATPDEAVYHVIAATDDSGTTWNDAVYGVAGQRIGYTDTANYIGGMIFPEPCYDNSVILTRNIAGQPSTLELFTSSDTTTTSTKQMYSTTANMLARPIIPRYGGHIGAMVSEIASYTSFADYDSKVALLPRYSPTTTNIQAAWPIGSVYISVVATNPATSLGFGTWVSFGSGRVLVGFDPNDSDFNAAEKTGGHKDMQQHTHELEMRSGSAALLHSDYTHTAGGTSSSGAGGVSSTPVRNAGTGDSGNLQPFIVVYMWKRIS